MSQNITWLGASYSNVPAVTLPKTGGGTARFTDVTDTTATASDVAQGLYFYTSAGVKTAGTASGGSGSPYYIRAVVVPEQTLTLDSQKKASLNDVTIGLSINGFYIVTFNGVEYYVTCHALFDWYLCLGDVNVQIKGQSEANSMTPFHIVSTQDMTQLSLTLWCKSDSASTVSVKVEELFFTDEITVAENIVPQQTVTLNADRMASLTAAGTITQGYHYAVTFDGVEYVCTAALLWNDTEHALGDSLLPFGGRDDYQYPFYIARGTGGTDVMGLTANTSHTVKVDRIELPEGGGITIDPLTITSNGTYTAPTNHAYTPVTVNVSGGGGTYQAKTNISPTTSSQTILPDSGYDALSSVQINAMPTGTAGTPSATKGSVSNHSVSVTPSVTNTTGYITGGTKTGTAVTVSASELVSGNKAITANGNNIDVADYATVSVNVSGGGSKNVQTAQSTTRSTSTSGTNVISLTCSTTGTYTVRWTTFRSNTSGTWGSRLYIGGTAHETMQTSGWSNHVQNREVTGVSISANQAVAVYVQSRGSNYYGYVGTLTIIQTA